MKVHQLLWQIMRSLQLWNKQAHKQKGLVYPLYQKRDQIIIFLNLVVAIASPT